MEKWDLPIANNPLLNRDDLARSLDDLMKPLLDRFVRDDAGLHIGNSSAHYDEAAALLEGESRLLWGLAPFAAGGGAMARATCAGHASAAITHILRGIKHGTDPESPSYWGIGGDRDQRYVEMAAIALSLLLAPGIFWDPLSEGEKKHLAAWLDSINKVELPPTNWEFFRVLVNLALKHLGCSYDVMRFEHGLEAVDHLYTEGGWYIDETNFDMYNPFAFHFYGLVYAQLEGENDPVRIARFRERARLFAQSYLPWFASDGSAVPFGRSLCYRFAASSFFSACAFAGEEIVSWGALKGIVLRNLRYWFDRPIFDHEGVLTIGYGYPNLLMAEQYNAPGSPYWALKTYLVLALPPDHPFWRAEEEPLPSLPPVSRAAAPNLLCCREENGRREHVYLLNAGQYPCWESVNAAAKYAKFAYSNRFGFCVSHGSYDLSKTGCDSSLLLSEGDGYWRERRRSHDRFSCDDYVFSIWEPWPDVRIATWLIPFGPWHVRIHSIESGRRLVCAEGGFSLPDDNNHETPEKPNIVTRGSGALLAFFPWAYGGIVDLGCGRTAELHKPEPNLNILYPKVLIPLLRGTIERGRSVLGCAVLAGLSADVSFEGGDGAAPAAWDSPPHFLYDPETGIAETLLKCRRVAIDLTAEPGKAE